MPCCFIVPSRVLRKLITDRAEADEQIALARSIRMTRLHRAAVLHNHPTLLSAKATATQKTLPDIRVFDSEGSQKLPGKPVDLATSRDQAAADAAKNVKITAQFYLEVFGRSSVDARGFELDSTIHYGRQFENAFWNGRQMVYGDGKVLRNFTGALDVIAHELTHGVTQFVVPPTGLLYATQSGALNESISDVFGSLVKQWHNKQVASDADWLIGATLGLPGQKALRSMEDPSKGYDPQPRKMSEYVHLPEDEDDDWGGVHVNSGIPNHAFYLVAQSLGGKAWEKAGRIWYAAVDKLRAKPSATFADFAQATVAVANQLDVPGDSGRADAVKSAWAAVEVAIV